jgi:hypothetical protein
MAAKRYRTLVATSALSNSQYDFTVEGQLVDPKQSSGLSLPTARFMPSSRVVTGNLTAQEGRAVGR